MGSLSAAETPAGILLAFYRRRQWRQPELAQQLGVSVEALLRSIRALSERGMPLVRDDSDKPHVWWRVPKDWAPQGILFAREDTPALLRVLARAPRSRERDALLAHASRSARVTDASSRVQPAQLTDLEQAWLPVIEDAAKGITLGMRRLTWDKRDREAPEVRRDLRAGFLSERRERATGSARRARRRQHCSSDRAMGEQ